MPVNYTYPDDIDDLPCLLTYDELFTEVGIPDYSRRPREWIDTGQLRVKGIYYTAERNIPLYATTDVLELIHG